MLFDLLVVYVDWHFNIPKFFINYFYYKNITKNMRDINH